MNLEDLKKWLRVDYNFEDSVITDLIESAKAELLLSGVPEYTESDKEYSLFMTAIKYIVTRDFETRGFITEIYKSKAFNEKTLQSMILKLKKC